MVLVMVSHKHLRELSLRTQLPLETYSVVAPRVLTPISFGLYLFLLSKAEERKISSFTGQKETEETNV